MDCFWRSCRMDCFISYGQSRPTRTSNGYSLGSCGSNNRWVYNESFWTAGRKWIQHLQPDCGGGRSCSVDCYRKNPEPWGSVTSIFLEIHKKGCLISAPFLDLEQTIIVRFRGVMFSQIWGLGNPKKSYKWKRGKENDFFASSSSHGAFNTFQK